MVRRIIRHRYFIPGACIVGCALIAGVIAAALILVRSPHGVAQAATNVSSGGNSHWAWNDAVGWIDFYAPGTVEVNGFGLTGYASSSIGPISFDCATAPSGNICTTSNYAVKNDGTGGLSGWAWNDAIGWISFCGGAGTTACPGTTSYQVTIDTNGDFHGWAWNDAVGWIDFNCANESTCSTSNYYVSAGWVATGTVGTLESITYDTNDTEGAQLDSVEWKGTQPSGTTVEFQFAVSNSSSGPWNFTGPDGTSNTYYVPTAPGTALPLDYSLYSNYRYFRYLVTLVSTPTSTPVITDVIVDWSP